MQFNPKYILEGHKPVVETDFMKWGRWFETADRRVAFTQISKEVKVSTVFLGLDHSFGGPVPLLFETLVFGGKHDGFMRRYATWDEAEKGHAEVVKAYYRTRGIRKKHETQLRQEGRELRRPG